MSDVSKIILSGPSGVGKDAVIDAWIAHNPKVKRVVTATTRPPREGEVHEEDYFFYSQEEMERRIAAGDFLEHMNVFGHLYGTPKFSVDKIVDEGGIAILRVDVQGAITLIPKMEDAVSVFIMPPSLEELRKRLEGRKSETPEKLQERLDTAIAEIGCAFYYDHIVVNDVVENAVTLLDGVLSGQEAFDAKLFAYCSTMDKNALTKQKQMEFLKLAQESGVYCKHSISIM